MSFAPVLPLGGFAGWAFLKRTQAAQQAAFDARAPTRREEEYFRERIGSIATAEELVADRRLLRVALGAFGLDGDVNNRFFIRKVLEEGTLDPRSLSNRLSDKRYQKLSAAFGFGDMQPSRNQIGGFADRILDAWRTRGFEAAVGERSQPMRLALNAERELAELAAGQMSEDAKWFTVMGQAPLRQVFETAFGLPKAFGALDIDRQLQILRDKAQQVFGDSRVSQFADPDRMEALNRRFLLRSDIAEGAGLSFSSGSAALMLLQSGIGRR
jgi:hypothetical protein